MALLKEQDRQALKAEFAALTHPVTLVVFTQKFECQYCTETRMIADEVAALSDLISVQLYDFETHREMAAQYGIDKIPATIIMRGGAQPKDYGIRLYGIPSGYEFSTLIEDIMMVSRGDSGLGPEMRTWASALTQPLHLQVFVTPTCPYCPPAVLLAHQLAMESDLIRGDMVEAVEFPHLSNKYHVHGVPRTVINETVYMEGAAPEKVLLGKLKQAVL